MYGLTLELFTGAEQDFELAQYRILAALRQVRAEFSKNRIYPHLARLIKLYATLGNIARQSTDLKKALPRKIKEVDWETGELVYEPQRLHEPKPLFFEELIHWALPHLKQAIEEGKAIFEFVDEHIEVEAVGLLPSYIDEGYLIVPDVENHTLHVIRYSVSIFTSEDERYRSLKTHEVKVVPTHPLLPPLRSLKLELVKTYHDLPNPATYLFNTDLDFPFESTLLPVSKRKLLQHLYAA